MNRKSESRFSLKDQLFNTERVQYLAQQFQAADENFDATGFVRQVMKALPELELKQRIVHIAATLETFLSADFRVSAKQVTAALPPPLDPGRTDDDFGDFIFAPLGEFVVRNGLAGKHLKRSLKTLKAITQRFSMEDAIRAFLNAYPDETLAELKTWATDDNYHVRRLVSEGTRPLLPWSKRVSIVPAATIPFLDTLHADATRYVIDFVKANGTLSPKVSKLKQIDLSRGESVELRKRHVLRANAGHTLCIQAPIS